MWISPQLRKRKKNEKIQSDLLKEWFQNQLFAEDRAEINKSMLWFKYHCLHSNDVGYRI